MLTQHLQHNPGKTKGRRTSLRVYKWRKEEEERIKVQEFWNYPNIQGKNITSDVDPDWLYPDPDPQNLINPDPDPDPGQ